MYKASEHAIAINTDIYEVCVFVLRPWLVIHTDINCSRSLVLL